MTKTDLRFVSPIFAVMEKAIRGVRPAYDSRENTIDSVEWLRPLRLLGYRPCPYLDRAIWPSRRACPFQAQIE